LDADSNVSSVGISDCSCNAGYDGTFGVNSGPSYTSVDNGASCASSEMEEFTLAECNAVLANVDPQGEVWEYSCQYPPSLPYGCLTFINPSDETHGAFNPCTGTQDCGVTIQRSWGSGSDQYICACKLTLFSNACTPS
jgi:hypothetical protein